MVTIIFESHSPTLDNEQHRASGHYDVALSPTGETRAKEMGRRYKDNPPAAIFCSDLQRSFKTAELAFGTTCPLFLDPRLRECDYGEFEHHSNEEIEAERPQRITTPFPGGESLQERVGIMKRFLQDLLHAYNGKEVLVIGHRATWYGLEHWINHRSLAELVAAHWTWQSGWTYQLRPSDVE